MFIYLVSSLAHKTNVNLVMVRNSKFARKFEYHVYPNWRVPDIPPNPRVANTFQRNTNAMAGKPWQHVRNDRIG